MRHGSWKVLARLNGGDLPRFENLTPERLEKVRMAELTDFEIYRVTTDPGETLNLAGRGLRAIGTLSGDRNVKRVCSRAHRKEKPPAGDKLLDMFGYCQF